MIKTNIENILISIITITKDDNKGLELTLKSINDNSENIELLIIDGSKKNLNSIPIKRFTDLKKIQIIKQKSQGIFNAMNEGLKAAKGKYVLFMNGGDQFHQGFYLEELFTIFKKDFDMIVLKTLIYSLNINKEIGINPPLMQINQKNFRFLATFLPNLFWPCHQSCIFNKKLHKNILYDDKIIGSDEKVIRFFLEKDFFLLNKICAIHDTSGISALPSKTIKNLSLQIKDSFKLRQYKRGLRVFILFLLGKILKLKILDYLRLFKYKFAYAIIGIMKKFIKTIKEIGNYLKSIINE